MTLYTSALAPIFAQAATGYSDPILLLKTNFGPGVTLDPVTMAGSSGNWVQGQIYLSGSDSYGFNMKTALKSYFGAQTAFLIQQLPNPPQLTDTTLAEAEAHLATLMTAQIQPTTIPAERPDARELNLTLIQRNNASLPPQELLQILRLRDDYATTNAIPIPRIASVAWRFKCILDPALTGLLATGTNYFDFSTYKSGDSRSSWPSGYYSTSYGSCRFATLILNGPSGLYFSSFYDNVAGTAGIYPTNYNAKSDFIFCPFWNGAYPINVGNIVKGSSSGAIARVDFMELRVRTWGDTGKGVLVLTKIVGQPFVFTDGEVLKVSSNNGVTWTDACTVAEFWTGQESRNLANPEDKYLFYNTPGGSVPLGVPLQFEFRIVKPLGGRTDITTGITQAKMTNLVTGQTLQICNFVGGIQEGALEDPITRIIPIIDYTSFNTGNLPIGLVQRITDLEVWSDYKII